MGAYKDIIDRVSKDHYYQSESDVGFKEAYRELDKIISDKTALEKWRVDAAGLKCRIMLKETAILFLESRLDRGAAKQLDDDAKEAKRALGAAAPQCAKTVAACDRVAAAAAKAVSFLASLYAMRSEILDVYGKYNDGKEKEFEAFLKECSDKLASLEGNECPVPELGSLFPATVTSWRFIFPSTKEAIKRKIKDISESVTSAYKSVENAACNAYFEKLYVAGSNRYDGYVYVPEQLFDEKAYSAEMRFVCSPFESEAEFAVCAHTRKNKLKAVRFRFNPIAVNGKDFLKQLKNMLLLKTAEDTDIYVFYGLASVKDVPLRTSIMKTIAELFKVRKGYALFHDNTGDRKLYCEYQAMYDAGKIDAELNAVCEYMTMPYYPDVIRILEEKTGDISGIDRPLISKIGAFMGYVGFNEVMSALASKKGNNWMRVMEEITNRNAPIAKAYMLDLPMSGQLLDGGWNTTFEVAGVLDADKPFTYDYDKIRELCGENIAEIMGNDALDMYEKCGVLVRYCLLCGEDVSLWKTFSDEERENRIRTAVYALACMLDVTYKTPVVSVLKELSVEKAGGLCCNGGQEIQYKRECSLNFDWQLGSVCHEVFHAFQYTLLNYGLKDWHVKEFGIKKERVDYWKRNNGDYISIDEDERGYRMQIFEADTYIFEKTCVVGADTGWSKSKLK